MHSPLIIDIAGLRLNRGQVGTHICLCKRDALMQFIDFFNRSLDIVNPIRI